MTWLTVEADRILYYNSGRNVILCDRWIQSDSLPPSGALLVKLNDAQLAKLSNAMRDCALAEAPDGATREPKS